MTASQEHQIDRFIAQEVYVNQSPLIELLLSKEVFNLEELDNLYETCKQRGEELCEACQQDEYCEEERAQEIFEWWVVSQRLAEKLRQKGEPIFDTDFGLWWGRTTSGQAISLDGVIKSIYDELNRS